MQINSSIGAHTLTLFGTQARGLNQQAGPSERGGAPAAVALALRFEPARSTEMQGVYADPRTAGPTQATEPGIAQRTIDTLKSVRNIEMKAVEQALQGEVEAALGRQLSEGESIYQLSEKDEMSLPEDVRRSTHELRVADINMRVAMGEAEPVWSFRRVTDSNRDVSAEELVDTVIAAQVDAQLGAIQRAKVFAREDTLMDLAHTSTGGLSEDVRSALAPNSEEEIGAMRNELIADRKSVV